MDIQINSATMILQEGATLEHALHMFGAQPPFAITLNGDFVARAAYHDKTLHAGDRIELVRAVGGG